MGLNALTLGTLQESRNRKFRALLWRTKDVIQSHKAAKMLFFLLKELNFVPESKFFVLEAQISIANEYFNPNSFNFPVKIIAFTLKLCNCYILVKY